MKIECSHCHKTYDIPAERIRALGEQVAFPCPACKASIEINLASVDKESETSAGAPPPPEEKPTGGVLKRRILRAVKDLPPMPQVAQKARELVADENYSFTDLAKIIETDQAIATRVLKLSNSPYYGVGNVTSIQHASVVLGMKTLNELLTMACASSVLGSEFKGYGQTSSDMWKHSLAVAGCAKIIANNKNPALADDAFSAGLIHDCGKIILDEYILERKEEFQRCMAGGEKSFLEAEKSILGFDHAEISGEVCEKWQIPKKLALAITYHHSPSTLQVNALVHIVHAADAIALMSGIGAGLDGTMYRIDKKTAEFLGLDSNQIGLYMAEALEYVEKTMMEM